jgi:hypothetical protein
MKKANYFLRLARRYGPVVYLIAKFTYLVWKIFSEAANYHVEKLRV